MDRFVGRWQNPAGNIIEITKKSRKHSSVSFYSGTTGQPICREYFENKPSINMSAQLDYYETSLEVDLWTHSSGFRLSLLYDWIELRHKPPQYYLVPALVQFAQDDFSSKYGHLFEPLQYYELVESKKADNTRP